MSTHSCYAVAQIEPKPSRLAESVDAHVRLAHLAADNRAGFVIFPELSLTGYSRALTCRDAVPIDDPTLRPIAEASRRRRIVIVVGLPLTTLDSGLLIANVAFFPDGRTSTYTKQYLHQDEEATFVPGAGGSVLSVSGTNIGLAICAEINYSSHIDKTVASGASVYAASCFFTPAGYDTNCRRLRRYAETRGVIVLMANFGGPCGGWESAGGSSIWDNTGRLVAVAPSAGEYVVVAQGQNSQWKGLVIL